MNISFSHSWVLWLLPLALWPLLAPAAEPLRNGWIGFAPRDRLSSVAGGVLRGLGALAVAALVIAVADPHRPEYTVERVGRGAEIVLLLDRSRSMDQGFAGVRAPPSGRLSGPEAIDYYFSQAPARLRESKGQVARRLLGEFTAQRPDDRFALIVFSTLPIRVLGFTQKEPIVQAAIAAGNIGRGLSETNIGIALEAAFEMFEDRPYTGSRIVMLVSDGSDRLDPDTRERLAQMARKQRVTIYWLYLRSINSAGLKEADASSAAADSVPELMLDRFFASIGTPYRAYEAGDPQALQQAIDAVNRMENLPITYADLVPQRDLAPWCHALALACVLLLIAASRLELRRWA